MEPNLAESIYIRSSIKFLHFVPFRQQIWPPRAILVSDWLMFKQIFSSETAWPNGVKLGRKHLCKILYKTSSFGSIWPTNMTTVTKNRTYGKIARFRLIISEMWRGTNDQHSKIYLPYNFEVNLITYLGVIALFSSNL